MLEEKQMAFDFKKEYKELYMPKSIPEIVDVPKANYIAVRGKGNPDEEGGRLSTSNRCIICSSIYFENEL